MMRGHQSMSAELLKHLQEAGIRPDHAIVSYLTHIGLTSDIAFVEFKPDTVELAGWCDKFKSEVTFGDAKIGPIDGDQLEVMKASLIATHKSITKKLNSSMPTAPPAAGPTVPSGMTKHQKPCHQRSTPTLSKPTTKSPSTARGEHSQRSSY